jgi:Na+-transporting NADH:ubiquinone oxidoreductase subunit C
MPLNKDSTANTFLVATVLCLVCALVVSSAAVALKSTQANNVQLDRKKNILKVTGFTEEEIKAGGGITELFASRFETTIIDMRTGEEAVDEAKAAMEKAKGKELPNIKATYDQLWASKRPPESGLSTKLEKKQDVPGIKKRENFSHVFMLKSEDGSSVEKFVFPVRGMGLWSMMQGYLAVEPDFQTVAGLTFYQQAETPGLGGEVENPNWKAKWPDKKIFDAEGQVALSVSKGDQTANDYGVDALSGATITSNGVSNMLEFWMGEDGFGPYIDLQKGGTTKTGGDDE